MCGIAGIYNLKCGNITAHCLKNMCDAMRHRGMDDEGYVFFQARNEPFKDKGFWIEKGPDMPSISSHEEWKHIFGRNSDFNLTLGHRHLSIIDLTSAGHQPMSNRTNGI